MRRPNIVMILMDDHASAIGAYGSVVNITPRIDRIARGRWLLKHCFATNALCFPSRASILTGTYSHINLVTTLETPIDASQPTWISQLRAPGYRTAVVGKWRLGDGEGHDPEGFDYWDVLIEQGEYHDPIRGSMQSPFRYRRLFRMITPRLRSGARCGCTGQRLRGPLIWRDPCRHDQQALAGTARRGR